MGEEEVKATADDSTVSKLYCCQKGYLSDPYIQFFAHGVTKRPPIINRGYWTRVHKIWTTLVKFLEASGPGAQIISLGAGYDTTFWMLKDRFPEADFSYVEMDFIDVCSRKLHVIERHMELLSKLQVEIDPKSKGK
jgi:O-methyltransferase involved in polyketide biosynthesis